MAAPCCLPRALTAAACAFGFSVVFRFAPCGFLPVSRSMSRVIVCDDAVPVSSAFQLRSSSCLP